ncbi:hypothetical protein [Chitinophaga alhagiae]|uniref:hypothetical protein n=1 Tax=Chitinophaga alhagiae TaxID=2203219 RepID=UPI000E5BE6F8|nr:hypothetical protein [Chitinophaga alhagiae]
MSAKHKKYTVEELLKTNTPEELAEAYVFPEVLTPEERKAAAEELAAARRKSAASFAVEDKQALQLFRLRMKMADYIKAESYKPQYSLGYFLKEYLKVLGMRRKTFAGEITIDPSLLSHLVNDKREPPEYIYFRLEIHSGNILPADYWFRIVEKQKAHAIKTDKLSRKKQQAFVQNRLSVDK